MSIRPGSATWFSVDTEPSGRGFGLAKITSGETRDDLRPWFRAICAPGSVEHWPGFRFQLARGGFADLQPVNRAFWLFSEHLRDVFEEIGKSTPLQWLEQRVVSQDGGEERTYWSPAPLEELAMWEDGSVVMALDGEHIIYGRLDTTKLESYRILSYWKSDSRPPLYVHRELLEAAEHRGCASGMKWDALPKESFKSA